MSPSLNKVASSSSSNSREGKYFVLQDEVDPCTRPGGVVTAGIYAHHACFVLKRTGGGASTSSCKTLYLPLGSLRSRRYSRAQGGKLEIPPAQKLSILSSAHRVHGSAHTNVCFRKPIRTRAIDYDFSGFAM